MATIAPDYGIYICDALGHLETVIQDNQYTYQLFSEKEISECANLRMGYSRGPGYGLLIILSRLAGMPWIYENLVPLLLGCGSALLFTKIYRMLRGRKGQIGALAIFTLSPIYLWLTFYPSTDMPCTFFTTLGIYLLCRDTVYGAGVSIQKPTNSWSGKARRFIISRSTLKQAAFLLSCLAALSFRPSLFSILPLSITHSLLIYKQNSSEGWIEKSIRIAAPFILLLSTYVFLYGNYGGNSFDYFFFSYSPPAPLGLWSVLHNYSENIFGQPVNLINLGVNITGLLGTMIYSIVYGFASVSGIQTSTNIGAPNFHLIASSLKLIYGLAIAIPGAYCTINKLLFTALNLKKVVSIKEYENPSKSREYIYLLLSACGGLTIMLTVSTLAHARYLLPVHAIISINAIEQWQSFASKRALLREKL